MKKRSRLRVVFIVLIVIVACYYAWSVSGRSAPSISTEPNLKDVQEFGPVGAKAGLVAIQAYMVPADYASEQAFRRKMESYFDAAAGRHWLDRGTVVVLPEYLGAWLVIAGEKTGVYTAETTDSAIRLLAISNLPSVLYSALRSPSPDRLRYAIFSMKGEKMASIYDAVLSGLAWKYQVTVVGGSIILPSPSVRNGKLTAGTGALYNICPVYRPDGSAEPSLVTKVFLTKDEQGWMKPGKAEDLPIFDTPAGRMGVLICADSWFPESYRVMSRKGAQLVAVPSYGVGDGKRDDIWKGYSGHRNPPDVDKADVKTLTEGQAWAKYAFAGRLPKSGIPNGIMVHLRGRLWDLGSNGSTVVVSEGRPTETPDTGGASIVCLRLP